MEKKRDRYDYDLHRQIGILVIICRLVKETPGATWPYIFATLGVLGGSQLTSFLVVNVRALT